MTRIACIVLALVYGATAAAASAANAVESRVHECIDKAAAAFEVSPLALQLIREVEAGAVGSVSLPNKDASYDIGPMQINSSWLPTLLRFGITESQVRDDPCINAYVGAWVYVRALADADGDLAMAMARYHSPIARYQIEYLDLILNVIDRHTARSSTPSH